MPKVVDIYVLEKKIGNGQFGDVYRGYSKVDGIDVAVKTIDRKKIKGKFTELLENQIKVLKSCKNNNVIQLLDIKKTVNNIYLIMEFCNEGDLGAYLKQKKKLPQDQAVEYFVQILHAFQTLVKNKIMHRDFKLPNILKHNGTIKIADFGFSKLLGTEDEQSQTILGSPLNMAPEVLDRQLYNSKADIWSIGVCFYELVFGKVPYTASNIIDLLKKIRKQPLTFPAKVSPMIQDVLKRMLVVDPAKRIDWNELFQHPITNYLQQKIEENLQQSMLCDKEELKFNMSKFYIKTNMVIDNPYEINIKEELNNHVKEVIASESPTKFKGKAIKRQKERNKKMESSEETKGTEKQIKEEEVSQIQLIKSDKQNIQNSWKLVLHQRNLYAYLGHLAEQLLELNLNIYAECLAFLILKKAMSRIIALKGQIASEKLFGVENWKLFKMSEESKKINRLIEEEEEIFNKFYETLAMKVLEKGTLSQFEEDLIISGKFTPEETNRRMNIRVTKEYFRRVEKDKMLADKQFAHFSKLIDSFDLANFENGFAFGTYYDELRGVLSEEMRVKCMEKYRKFMESS